MSVNAINGAEQQPQRSSASLIAPAVTLGAVGAGAGYLFGAKRPNLEKVFALEPDTFTSTVENAEGEAKEAADKIKGKIDELAGNEYKVTGEAKTNFENALNRQTLADDHAAVVAEKEAQEAVDKLITEAGDDAAKLEAIKTSDEAKALKTAKDEVREAKIQALRAAEDDATKGIVSAYDTAVEAAKSKKAAKITELAGNEEMKTAYGKIKKFFPKEGKGKAALLYGGIAAGVALIGSLLLGGSKKTQA